MFSAVVFLFLSSCALASTSEYQAILELEDGGVLPSRFLEADSRQVAQALVQRLQNSINTYEKHHDQRTVDILRESKVLIHFPLSVMHAVIQKGYQNKYQTGTTRGCNRTDHRCQIEDRILEIAIERRHDLRQSNPAHVLRSKSAYLDVYGRFRKGTPMFLEQYGELVAVMKDVVKERATWIPDDSYELKYGWKPVYTFQASHARFYVPTPYIEVQIWGELDLRDIAEFWVPEGISERDLQSVQSAGLPVYQYRLDKRALGSRRRVRSKRPLFAGDAKVTKTLNRRAVAGWAEFFQKHRSCWDVLRGG